MKVVVLRREHEAAGGGGCCGVTSGSGVDGEGGVDVSVVLWLGGVVWGAWCGGCGCGGALLRYGRQWEAPAGWRRVTAAGKRESDILD
nr:hypothetical protein [Tanacetum cinerariifolium]